jgi:hypothetical protein
MGDQAYDRLAEGTRLWRRATAESRRVRPASDPFSYDDFVSSYGNTYHVHPHGYGYCCTVTIVAANVYDYACPDCGTTLRYVWTPADPGGYSDA